MDEFLILLARKHLNLRAERIIENDFYPRKKTLIDKIMLLCRLMKNNAEQHPEEEITQNTNDKLHDFVRNIERATFEVSEWMFVLQKERSDLNQFQRNIETDWKTTKFAKKNIEENLTKIVTIRSVELSSKVFATKYTSEMRKNSMQMLSKLFDLRLKSLGEVRCLRMNDLYNERCNARKRCLNQFMKYDRNIESLCTYKTTLVARKHFIDEEYIVIQNQLVEQRALYKQLKSENELNMKRAFLIKLEHFRRNRAAKIIQRNWKLYCTSTSWRRRKGRK